MSVLYHITEIYHPFFAVTRVRRALQDQQRILSTVITRKTANECCKKPTQSDVEAIQSPVMYINEDNDEFL